MVVGVMLRKGIDCIRGEPQLTGIGLKWEWAQGELELVAKS